MNVPLLFSDISFRSRKIQVLKYGWYERWEPPHRQTDMFLFGVLYKESTLTTIPHIFPGSQSHNKKYTISVKIGKHHSSKNYEKDKESKWLFYI